MDGEAGTEGGEAVTTPAVEISVAGGGEDLAKVRDLVLQAYPEVVPDLVRGGSVDELLASVEPAKAAYQRIADRVRAGATTVNAEAGATVNVDETATVVVQPPAVPAGGASLVIDPANLPPTSKIAQGLRERRS